MASWCDKLASAPSVGCTFEHHFASSASLIEALTPLVDKWIDKDKAAFTVDQQDAFGIQLATFDGFHYALNPAQMSVEFRHRLKLKSRSAGPPTAELLSRPLPYTALLAEVMRRFHDAASLIISAHPRKLTRIGIVTLTVVNEDEAPPGILRFAEYASKPWGTSLQHYNIEVTANLNEDKKGSFSDRCIHIITKPEQGDGLITVRLDWQRTFSTPKQITSASLKDVLAAAHVEAMKYFEDVGEGNRFDEQLISKTA